MNEFTIFGKPDIIKMENTIAIDEMKDEFTDMPIPRDYPSALKALVEEHKKNKKLLAENKAMKSKAEYFDSIVEHNMLTTFMRTAEEFHMKKKQLVDWLLTNKFIYRDNKGSFRPYPEYADYFHVDDIKSTVGNNWVGTQTYITPKGKETFRLMLGK